MMLILFGMSILVQWIEYVVVEHELTIIHQAMKHALVYAMEGEGCDDVFASMKCFQEQMKASHLPNYEYEVDLLGYHEEPKLLKVQLHAKNRRRYTFVEAAIEVHP